VTSGSVSGRDPVPPSGLTDAVVEDARRGDSHALTTVYESVAPSVLAYLRGRGSQDPEALMQDVFLQLLPRLRHLTGGASGVRALAFTIAHARLVDEFRRRGRSRELPYASDLDERKHTSAETQVLDQLDHSPAAAALASIGEDQRTVIMLRVFGDLSLDETARIVGKSVGAVKQLQRRGLLALRAHLDEVGELP